MRGRRGQDPLTLKYVERLGLALAVFGFYGAVQHAYHGAWGRGLAVIVILIAARQLTRYCLPRSPMRPALSFGGCAVALSAFVFAPLAMGRLPAWIALLISLLAGSGLAVAGLEVGVEGDLAGDAHLVGGDAPLEEVRQLLNVLQVHERERVPGPVQRLEPNLASSRLATCSR